MHYLLKASGLSSTGQTVSFKNLPDGSILYFEPFRNRVLRGLIVNPNLFCQAAGLLGDRLKGLGSAAVTIDILPRLPVTLVIWCGDEEVPVNATALFDANVRYYLSTEDLVVIAASGASLLCRTAKALRQDKTAEGSINKVEKNVKIAISVKVAWGKFQYRRT